MQEQDKEMLYRAIMHEISGWRLGRLKNFTAALAHVGSQGGLFDECLIKLNRKLSPDKFKQFCKDAGIFQQLN